MIILYGIKNCDTVKKSIEWLKSRNIQFQFHDYKTKGISEEKLKDWSNEAGWENLINKKGTTWKKLDDLVKDQIKDEAQAISLMKENTSVIRRPVVEDEGKLVAIGFDEAKFNTLI